MRPYRGAQILLSVTMLATLSGSLRAGDGAEAAAWLGVSLERGSAQDGVRVARIFTDSPADAAGLREKDTIVATDGVRVLDAADLVRRIAERGSGGWISLTISRGGEEAALDARLAGRPALLNAQQMRRGFLGVTAIDLPQSLREHFGAPGDAGVMISEVATGSPAEAAGIELGDVLFEMDDEPLRSASELATRIHGAGVGNKATFAAVRAGSDLVFEARIEIAPPEPADPQR